jgi:hypothetical protein
VASRSATPGHQQLFEWDDVWPRHDVTSSNGIAPGRLRESEVLAALERTESCVMSTLHLGPVKSPCETAIRRHSEVPHMKRDGSLRESEESRDFRLGVARAEERRNGFSGFVRVLDWIPSGPRNDVAA